MNEQFERVFDVFKCIFSPHNNHCLVSITSNEMGIFQGSMMIEAVWKNIQKVIR